MTNNKMQPDVNALPEPSPRDQVKPVGPDEQRTGRESESEPLTANGPRVSLGGRRPLFRN